MCYHAAIGVGISAVPKIWERWSQPFWIGGVADTFAPAHVRYHAAFGLRQTERASVRAHRVPPFKVTQGHGTDTYQSVTCDFLLVIHS